LIRGVEVNGSTARIKLTYTCMGCPATDMIQDDIRERLLRMEEIEEVEIEEVWDSWSRENISKKGLIQLQKVGVV
jgi:metal-sulfur cluster biosynthetic enzyme